MPYPASIPNARICITVTQDGVTAYGNRKAFISLAQWMTWIGNADETEHYECHLRLHLQSAASLEANEPKNVWVLFDKKVVGAFPRATKDPFGFEVTFMAVEERQLDVLSQYEASGLLPDTWNQQTD